MFKKGDIVRHFAEDDKWEWKILGFDNRVLLLKSIKHPSNFTPRPIFRGLDSVYVLIRKSNAHHPLTQIFK